MATHIHIEMGGGSQGGSGSNTAAKTAVSTTYSELKALRDSGKLVPGAWYRITDYECTTSQADTMSAGHQFDIIVLARDESHLSEEAYAAHHGTAAAAEENNEQNEQNEQNNQNVHHAEQAGEEAVAGEGGRARSVDYFANNKLEAWKLKYCLDNDTDRFAWACDGTDKFYIEIEDPKQGVIRMYRTAIIEDGTVWQYGDDNPRYTAADPEVGDNLCTDSTLQSSDTQITAAVAVEGIDGKGVIYGMIDEFGNDCPYDFKNIMFKRFEITSVKNTQGNAISDHDLEGQWGLPNAKVAVDGETSEWFYTFSSVNDGTVTDASLSFSYDFMQETEDTGVGNNVMKSLGEGKAYLNNIVFVNSEGDLTCYGNRFGMDCGNITLGDWCTFNTFGNDCYNNTFGNYCSYNTFGNYFQGNTFGNNNYNNTFGNYCNSNTFGNYFQFNTFGNGCESNTFGNRCNNNTFGNSCSSNTFGNGCSRNTFGNNCWYNTFGNSCGGNTFGNSCSRNTFGNDCSNNTFGNSCYENTFGNNIQQFTVFEGVQYCDVTGGNNAANTRKNCQILNGTAGASNSLLTISFTPNVSYAQVAGFNSSGTLKIWNPADLAN